MAQEPSKVLTISDLLKLSQPLTATISLHSNSNPELNSANSLNPKFPISLNPSPNFQNFTYSDPDFRDFINRSSDSQILQPLNDPSILVGTLKLPSLHHSPCPTNANCLLFSDGSSPPICCDILNFRISLINRKIKVLSWNFIPFGSKRGAFLEIIKWDSLVTDHSEFAPLGSESFVDFNGELNLKSGCRVCGVLESISPVSAVPCSSGSNESSNNLRGFLANINVCECKLCKLKNDEVGLNQEELSHCYTKSVIVYFVASASYWHPVLSKLIGGLVVLLGLGKKLVYIGKEESQLMYVTAERSFLKLLKVASRKWLCKFSVIKGKGECGVYVGFVKGVYLQGMLVELDREVWLLLTDKLVVLPHSVRVGALICVRNVYFVNPNFSWTKMLILGSCVKTSISILQFSPLGTRCHMFSRSQSMLEKLIEVLPFSVRLWVLLTITSLRKKFSGILSEKDILGSKYSKGLAQTYATSHLSMPILLSRKGVFMEFCKHDLSDYPSEMNYNDLKLVLPISHFIRHSEAMWLNMNVVKEDTSRAESVSCEAKSHAKFSRRIVSSKDIGIVLVGSLQFSPSSGRLQLVDGTGAIDVVVPDLPSVWSVNGIYEVCSYSLVMEGVPEQSHHSEMLKQEPFSCRHMFHSCPIVRNADLAFYVYFHLRDATCKNRLIHPHEIQEDGLREVGSGRFHLLRITHKFPVRKFHGEAVISRQSSLYAEAMVLPWDLFLGESSTNAHVAKDFKDKQEESIKSTDKRTYLRKGSCKRCKINNASNSDFCGITSVLNGVNNGSSGPLNDGSGTVRDSNNQNGCDLWSPVEIHCSAITRYVDSHKLVTSGLLRSTKTSEKLSHVCKQTTGKVLLEFEFDSYCKYQSLQIGNCYLVQHQKEEVFCSQNDSRQVNCAKVLVTSGTLLWSLSFLSDESSAALPSKPPLHKCSTCSLEAQSEGCHQTKLLVLRSPGKSSRHCSDFEIHLSANCLGILELDHKESEENRTTLSGASEEVVRVSMQDSACQLPQGRLMTVHGQILTLDTPYHRPIDSHGGFHEFHHSQRFFGNVRVSVLKSNQLVKITGPCSNHMFPVGFGPGVDATFHRVLSSGKNTFTLTPVSFVVISSLREVISQHSNEYPDLSSASVSHSDSSVYSISSCLLSDLIGLDSKPVWVRCRVLSVHFLVLEKVKYPRSNISSNCTVSVPLAGFVLEDGSSMCCCWANADKAAKLLRLHEGTSLKVVKGNGSIGTNSTPKAAGHHIAKIVEKHGRIIVQNFGSSYDSSIQDLNLSVSLADFFSRLDENILKLIIFNASFGSTWNVLGSVMKPEAVDQLARHHSEMATTIVSMQNVWIQEVSLTNPLTEARNLVQELLCG